MSIEDASAQQTVQFNARQFTPVKSFHYVTVVQNGTIHRSVRVTTEPIVLGRDPSRSFFLSDPDVSRSHCELRLAGDRVVVRDLASTNGTFVDGARVTGERELPVASQLQIGRHALRHELLTEQDVARHEELARDLLRARDYVQALIPAPLDRGPLRTEWCFVPSSVLGGDALGYHDLGAGCLSAYVIDVCGHGVGSAMHSASVLNALRGHTLPNTDFGEPAEVLARLNDIFEMDHHSGMYFSIFYGVLDPAARRLRYSSAGHPPAMLLGADGKLRHRLFVKNPPIGTMKGRAFAQAEVPFEAGDRLYVFSDGAYEILDREGCERTFDDFERELTRAGSDRSAGEPRRLYDAARSLAGAELLADDYTMLVVEHTQAVI
jgi:serine phosphatase RsbU (regulator of sigma subunit)